MKIFIMADDARLEALAEVFLRAKGWHHLPKRLTFEEFLRVITRGDDPFVAAGGK